jgi:hypothetical protein
MITNWSLENRPKASSRFWKAAVVMMRVLLYGCAACALIALAWRIDNGDSLIGIPFGILILVLYALRGATALSAPGTLERGFHRWLRIGARITGVCFVITMIALWPVALPLSIIALIEVGLLEGTVRILEWAGRRYVDNSI